MKINVAQEFTRTPGGRYREEGAYSGQQFREEHLKPAFLHARLSGETAVIELDGTYGYSTGWLEEVFGGLSREYSPEEVAKRVRIMSEEEPYLLDEICQYIQGS